MNVSSAPSVMSQAAMRPPEATERGPDRDGDGDDQARAAPAKAAPAAGTGLRIDTWA